MKRIFMVGGNSFANRRARCYACVSNFRNRILENLRNEVKKMQITIPVPDDFHAHLRQGEMLRCVIEGMTRWFNRLVVMPNTDPPILDGAGALRYRDNEILPAARDAGCEHLKLIMTIQIREDTTPALVTGAAVQGVVAGKLYPQGVTTNSQNDVRDFAKLDPIFEQMSKKGMLLLIHGEDPDPNLLPEQREEKFLPTLVSIARKFPKLKIVLEHISTEKAIAYVESLPANVAATITVHHLFITREDANRDPHNLCMPIAKTSADREALRRAATSGNPKFFLGTDSAPHSRFTKERKIDPAKGVYSPGEVAIPLLAEVFECPGGFDLGAFRNFASVFGAEFYGLPVNTRMAVRLVEELWQVPETYNGIVPFWAGKKLKRKLKELVF